MQSYACSTSPVARDLSAICLGIRKIARVPAPLSRSSCWYVRIQIMWQILRYMLTANLERRERRLLCRQQIAKPLLTAVLCSQINFDGRSITHLFRSSNVPTS